MNNSEWQSKYDDLLERYRQLKRRHESLKIKAAAPNVFRAATIDMLCRSIGRIEPMRLDRYFHHPPVLWPLERLASSAARPTDVRSLPSIALVTPSFNQARFLSKTMESVFSQHYPRLEYVVQDGGSTDGSREIIEHHSNNLHAWSSAPDGGQTQAINSGFACTTGEIMGWLNSDDCLVPGALAHVAAYFLRHPEVDAIYGYRAIIDENDQMVGHWAFPPVHRPYVIDMIDYIPQETLFWRRSLWEAAGGRLDESFHFAMDWELILRFLHIGARFALIPRFLGIFRAHANQKSSVLIDGQGLDEMRRLRDRQRGGAINWHTFDRVFRSLQIRGALRSLLLRSRGLLPPASLVRQPSA